MGNVERVNVLHEVEPDSPPTLGRIYRRSGEGAEARGLAGACVAVTAKDCETLEEHASTWKAKGADALVVRLGTGLEPRAVAEALAHELCDIQARVDFRLLLEVHRAAITHDPAQAVFLVGAEPRLRFCLNVAEWFVGHEMLFGNLARTLAFTQPVLARTRALVPDFGTAEWRWAKLPPRFPRNLAELHATLALRAHRRFWAGAIEGFARHADPGEKLYLLLARSEAKTQPVFGLPDGQAFDPGSWARDWTRWVLGRARRFVRRPPALPPAPRELA